MNREIKFRAWHRSAGIMSRIFDLFGYKNIHQECDLSACEVMQFTGLKDCDGVDIYEGDIVDHGGIGYGLVVFDKSCAAFKIKFSGTTRKWFVDMLSREYDILSVIGNIRENPELLEQQQ